MDPVPAAPEVAEDVDPRELAREVREELRSLHRPVADTIARHLIMAGRLLDEDPDTALAHAVAARRLGTRIPAVREAVGVAAYHAGQWRTATAELRTYQRMTGRQSHLALLADCERAQGRPGRAIDIYRSADMGQLTREEALELLIVAAGARADLGQHQEAVTMLEIPQLSIDSAESARLRYAYADALLAAGHAAQARQWLSRTVEVDPDNLTGAVDRLLELDGVTVDDARDDEAPQHESPDTPAPDEAVPASEQEATPAPSAPSAAVVESAPTAEGAPDAKEPAASARPERLVDAYDLILFDLDGVVYRGAEPVPHAVEVINALRSDGPAIVFVTNNASRAAGEVATQLTGLGVVATDDDVLTSAEAAAQELARRLPGNTPVLVVGSPALADEVRRVGLRPVAQASDEPAAVVQGYGPAVGWSQLAEATVAIRAGAHWVATNTDTTLPTERGPLPGNGALVAALRTTLGRDPDVVVGKPGPGLLQAAADRAGAQRVLVVGDRLDTDIEGAYRAGMHSLLVRTGVDAETDLAGLPAHHRPTYVADDLTALLRPA